MHHWELWIIISTYHHFIIRREKLFALLMWNFCIPFHHESCPICCKMFIIFIIILPTPCIIIMAIDSIINICALIVDINCDKSSTSQALKMIYLQMRCLDGDEDTIHAKFALRWKSDSQFFVLWVIPFALWFITDLLLIW